MFDMMKLSPAQRLVYRREKHMHDKFCDGDGNITTVNKFTGDGVMIPCPYCKRIEKTKQRKLEKTVKNGTSS